MKSSEVAKLADVTVRTLRHYHAIGLLPEPSRGENGYREYEVDDLVRLLRIKRLTTLGFSLSRIGEVLDEMDRNLADSSGPNADAALDELDRELELHIEQLQEQRRTIALLKRERLDPDLPVGFARISKQFEGTLNMTSPLKDGDRTALLLAGHLSTDEETAEFERIFAVLSEEKLLERMNLIQMRFDELPADAPREQIDHLVEDGVELFNPIFDSVDLDGWNGEIDAPFDSLMNEVAYRGLNEAQAYAQDRLMEATMARIYERLDAASDSHPTNPPQTA